MAHADPHHLVRQLITGDPAATDGLSGRAGTSSDPLVFVVAALTCPGEVDLLARALRCASTARDRQVVAVASAFLAGDSDRVHALAREHLVDHPDSVLVAWLAASTPSPGAGPDPTPHREPQED